MKNKFYVLAAALLVGLASCKKEKAEIAPEDSANSTLTTNATVKPFTVTTLAGRINIIGSRDGQGAEAGFNGAEGLDLTSDGTIYVTSLGSIRKVSPTYYVTRLDIVGNQGQEVIDAQKIKIQKDGTINFIASDRIFKNSQTTWIVKPSGEVVTPASKTDFKYMYQDLQKDPYTDELWVAGQAKDTVNNKAYAILEKFKISNGKIGTNTYRVPVDSLTAENMVDPKITSFFCGYNGVKYIVINNISIYKLTPAGVFTQIYRDIDFNIINNVGIEGITSIVATKDSRTIYVANGGRIRSISNGVSRTLVGPNHGRQYQDGVGAQADVHAKQLALSKDENTIYFTDRNALRKLTLK
jgi:hypothetical protein